MATQVSRDPDAYGDLNAGMHLVIIDSFSDTQTYDGEPMDPNDTLRRGGTTIGFLEEARHEALYGEASDEQARNAWEARFAYHGAGGIVNFIPGVGDITQRSVDSLTQAWLEEENNRIQDQADEESQDVSGRRNGQLAQLEDEWYQQNQEWADNDDNYDTRSSRLDEIHGSADTGRSVNEGGEDGN